MRNRWTYLRPLCGYLGVLLVVFGVLMLVPLAVRYAFAGAGDEVPAYAYWVPAAGAVLVGLLLQGRRRLVPLDGRRAMVLCALAWIVVSAVGALPFHLGLDLDYLDACFETVCGFTTTGITMLSGLDEQPASILFWRSFTQWLGGLGILTFFLAIVFTGGSAHQLYTAESHKIFSQRPAPGLFHTLRILWGIYILFTAVIGAALFFEGLDLFDALLHAMTTVSTGGYSPHELNVAHFAAHPDRYPHATLIEYTFIVGMLLGGINFLVHYRLLRGGVRALWDTQEMRLWWTLLVVATAVVALDHFMHPVPHGTVGVHEVLRGSLFHVVSIATSTGFVARELTSDFFGHAARQVFLVLMLVGGCVGSTSGGFKVLRIGVLFKMLARQLRRLLYGPSAVHPMVLDGETIDDEELRRIAALFFAWVLLILAGGVVTGLFSEYGTLESASGMFSTLGNIGPCYIPAAEMRLLHPAVKLVYIFGMFAGRLEILPLLLLFSRRTWR